MNETIAQETTSDMTLPNGWVSTGLVDLLEVIRGISFPSGAKTSEPRDGYIGCLRTTNVQRDVQWEDLWFVPEEYLKREEQLVRPLDILISTANSFELVGKVAQVHQMPVRATLGAFISLIRVPNQLDAKYFYFLLSSSKTQERIRKLASTTTNISNVSTKKLRTLALKVAPFAEQRRIVAAIEEQFARLDAGVAALKRTRANLKRYRASVLKAAVEGRLTERWREENPDVEDATTLLQRILEERRARWEEDQLARYAAKKQNPPKNWRSKYKEPAAPDTVGLLEPPEGWAWASLSAVADTQLGKMLSQAAKTGQKSRPYLRNQNVRWDSIDTADMLRMDFEEREVEKFGLLPGDVLICEGGEPGRAAVWREQFPGALYQKALHRVRFPSNGVVPEYLVHHLRAGAQSGALTRHFTGSTIKHFTGVSLAKYAIHLPPLAEQEEIVAEVERRLSVAEGVEAQVEAGLKRAARLRQAILKRAFEGRLVPQDLEDEPAEVLLERIRAERAAVTAKPKRKGRSKTPRPARTRGGQPGLF